MVHGRDRHQPAVGERLLVAGDGLLDARVAGLLDEVAVGDHGGDVLPDERVPVAACGCCRNACRAGAQALQGGGGADGDAGAGEMYSAELYPR